VLAGDERYAKRGDGDGREVTITYRQSGVCGRRFAASPGKVEFL